MDQTQDPGPGTRSRKQDQEDEDKELGPGNRNNGPEPGARTRKLLIIGSSNWTLSSRCNSEMSMLIDLTYRSSISEQVLVRIEEYLARGQPFTSDKATAAFNTKTFHMAV